MTNLDGYKAQWRKSSKSGSSNDSNCVEVAVLLDAVAVRDSKDDSGQALIFTRAAWTVFVEATKRGEFDR